MKCTTCESNRVLSFSGKCSDLFNGRIQSKECNDYVPDDMGIGGGDYVEGDLCLNCGQMQGTWPLPLSELETQSND
jgi:hypothetical protein